MFKKLLFSLFPFWPALELASICCMLFISELLIIVGLVNEIWLFVSPFALRLLLPLTLFCKLFNWFARNWLIKSFWSVSLRLEPLFEDTVSCCLNKALYALSSLSLTSSWTIIFSIKNYSFLIYDLKQNGYNK